MAIKRAFAIRSRRRNAAARFGVRSPAVSIVAFLQMGRQRRDPFSQCFAKSPWIAAIYPIERELVRVTEAIGLIDCRAFPAAFVLIARRAGDARLAGKLGLGAAKGFARPC